MYNQEKEILEKNRWVHSLCYPLSIDRNGPFLKLPDGKLMSVNSNGLSISDDGGKTWSKAQYICQGINSNEPASFYILRTRNGTIVIIYLNFTKFKFNWNEKVGEPENDCCLELWAIRSVDGGKTWIDNQKLFGGYNANFFGFIQTRSSRIVAVAEHLVSNPGRWVVCSLFSDDEGKSWKRSNFIDLGGHGHHDGATEPTVAELSDGKLLMLIRTNLDRFWQSFSEDGGKYWRIIHPSQIDASSSPGHLLKLNSGRLVLVWNRLNPEGGQWKKSEPSQASELPVSWHREELSISFSENDGKEWTKPVVIARQKGGQLSYPYLFEYQPGEIWLTVGFTHRIPWQENALPLRVRIKEKEMFNEVK